MHKAVSIIPKQSGIPNCQGVDGWSGAWLQVERGGRNWSCVFTSSHDNTVFLVTLSGVSVSPEHTGRAALFR